MSLPLVNFAPLNRQLPQVGFGCARLVGRSSLRQSAKVVETALSLGIRYFDVAPGYGMGTAEEVLGQVVGNSKDVVIATKVGVPRPPYSATKNFVRGVAKPILDRARAAKTLARRFYAPKGPPSGGAQPRYDFSEATIRAGIEESLRLLRRDRIDVYLAHEPHADDLSSELAARFASLQQAGQIVAYGAGVDARTDRWSLFGSVWQSGWPGGVVRTYTGDIQYVFHGTIRYAPKDRAGATVTRVGQLVREAMRLAPGSIILVSTSTPRRLSELIEGIVNPPRV